MYLVEIMFSSGYISRDEIAGSYGRFVFFIFLRNHHIVFCNGHANLYSHQQRLRGPLPTTSLPAPLISCLLYDNHSNRWEVRYYFDFDLNFSDD